MHCVLLFVTLICLRVSMSHAGDELFVAELMQSTDCAKFGLIGLCQLCNTKQVF